MKRDDVNNLHKAIWDLLDRGKTREWIIDWATNLNYGIDFATKMVDDVITQLSEAY